jgi:hypothetical protein
MVEIRNISQIVVASSPNLARYRPIHALGANIMRIVQLDNGV